MIKTVPYLLLALVSLCLMSGTSIAGDDSLPPGFRFVGNYRFDKRMKIRDGASFNVRSKAFFCRVYTDGITVRVYGESATEAYTSFTIHRNDGILTGAGTNKMETVPGLQAYSLVGNILRQLTLTEERLVLTKFPALSDIVEITYANRRITVSHNK
jgi:hypothetical protein